MGKDLIVQLNNKILIHGQEIPGECSLRSHYQKRLIDFWYGFLTENNIKNSYISAMANSSAINMEPDTICKFKHSAIIPLRLFVIGYMDTSTWNSLSKIGSSDSIIRDKQTGKLDRPLVVPASTRSNLPIIASKTHNYFSHYITQNCNENASNIYAYARKKGITIPSNFFKKNLSHICDVLTAELYEIAEGIYTICSTYAEKHSIVLSGFSIQFGIDDSGDIVVTDKFLSSDEAFYFVKGQWRCDESIKPYELKPIIDYIHSSSYVSNIPLSQITIPKELLNDSSGKLLDLIIFLKPTKILKTTE